MANVEYYDIDNDNFLWAENVTLESFLNTNNEIKLRIKTEKFNDETIEKLQKLISQVAGSNIKIETLAINYPDSYIYNENDVEKIKKLHEFCEENDIVVRLDLNDPENTLAGTGTYNQFIIARKEVEDFVQKVNSLTIEENGKQTPLSTAEKFLLAYNFASDRFYNSDDEHFLNSDMRNWIGLLSTDFAICSGFKSLLKCLCDRMFTEDELKCFCQSSTVYYKENDEEAGGHANNLVFLKDEKYGIENIFYCDSCWDCRAEDKEPNFAYIIPFEKILTHKNYKFEFDKPTVLYERFGANIRKSYFDSRNEYFENFLFKKFGMKNYQEIEKTYDIDGKAKKTREEIEKQQHIVKDLCYEKIEKLLQDEELAPILNLTTTRHLPKEFYEKYPFLNEFDDYISKFSFDTPIKKDLFEKYYKFYQENKERFEKAIEKDKKESFQIFHSLTSIIEHNLYRNENKFFNSYEFTKNHQNKLKGICKAQRLKMAEKAKPLFEAKELPEKLLIRAYKAIAKIKGIEDANYAQKSLTALRQMQEDKFNNSENISEIE